MLLWLWLLLVALASGADAYDDYFIPEDAVRVTAADLDAHRVTQQLEALLNDTAPDSASHSATIPLRLQRLSRLLDRAEARKQQLQSSGRLLSFNRRKFFRGCKSPDPFFYYLSIHLFIYLFIGLFVSFIIDLPTAIFLRLIT